MNPFKREILSVIAKSRKKLLWLCSQKMLTYMSYYMYTWYFSVNVYVRWSSVVTSGDLVFFTLISAICNWLSWLPRILTSLLIFWIASNFQCAQGSSHQGHLVIQWRISFICAWSTCAAVHTSSLSEAHYVQLILQCLFSCAAARTCPPHEISQSPLGGTFRIAARVLSCLTEFERPQNEQIFLSPLRQSCSTR